MDMSDRPSVRPSRRYTTGFLPRPSCMTTLANACLQVLGAEETSATSHDLNPIFKVVIEKVSCSIEFWHLLQTVGFT
jgi:hypothetical protein